MFNKMPDDPIFEEMDQVTKLWMFNNWVEDFKDTDEVVKNVGYLVGSFINPEMVKQMLEAQTFRSSDAEFEESTKMIEREKQEEEGKKPKRKRKRKMIK